MRLHCYAYLLITQGKTETSQLRKGGRHHLSQEIHVTSASKETTVPSTDGKGCNKEWVLNTAGKPLPGHQHPIPASSSTPAPSFGVSFTPGITPEAGNDAAGSRVYLTGRYPGGMSDAWLWTRPSSGCGGANEQTEDAVSVYFCLSSCLSSKSQNKTF